MGIEACPAREADAAVLAEMIDAFNVEYGRPAGLHTSESVLRDGFGPDRGFTALIAWDGDETAGYTLYYPTWESITPARGIYMQDLWVRPAWRSKSVGPVLVAALSRIVLERGATHLWWRVDTDNERGLAFYKGIGASVDPAITMALEGEALARMATR
ncbi:MAG: GNAT family N-acetyltransferase [Alphaproteobacteria bacterium]